MQQMAEATMEREAYAEEVVRSLVLIWPKLYRQ